MIDHPLNVNYGVFRKVGRKKESRCGKLSILGNWNSRETHTEIREKIMEANPGWSIMGYALVKSDRDFCEPACPYLSPTEEEQDSQVIRAPHRCGKYNKPLLHGEDHPRIQRLPECNEPQPQKEETKHVG